MQHINDDMDELYRHAAEDYPLKIKGADWDGVAKRLNDKSDDAALPVMMFPSSKGGSVKKYKYLLLLLLIPAALLTIKYTGLPGIGSNTKHTASTVAKSATTTGDKTLQPAENSAVTPAKNAAAVKVPAAVNAAATGQIVKQAPGKNAQATLPQAVSKDNLPAAQSAASQVPGLADLHAVTRQQDMQQALDKLHANNTATIPQQPLQPATDNGNNKIAGEPLVPAAGTGAVKDGQPKNDDDIVKANHDSQPATTTAATDKPDEATGPVTVKRPKRLYAGVYVAPDYTTVKYQPGNKVGFDFGGMLGYKITKSLAVEVGLSIDKKYYTSDGKYYNNTNNKLQGWLQNKGTLLNISGYSNLTSLPVIVKYDFKPGRDGNFFVAGGLISYIVHEENYRYQFDKNRIIYTADKSTKISTTNLLANVSISAGYESALGNFCSFRIEPYYRVPVKGIGLGGLPITSMGLNIGLTKKIR